MSIFWSFEELLYIHIERLEYTYPQIVWILGESNEEGEREMYMHYNMLIDYDSHTPPDSLWNASSLI